MAKPKTSLLEMAKAASKKPPKLPKCWLDYLDSDTREQVIEVCRFFNEEGGNWSAIVEAVQNAGVDTTADRMQTVLERIQRGLL